MKNTASLYYLFNCSLTTLAGWIQVPKNTKVDINIESAPLEVQTKSTGELKINFFDAHDDFAGRIQIKLSAEKSEYKLNECTNRHVAFDPDLKTGDKNVWRMEKKRDMPDGPRMIVYYNGEKVSSQFNTGNKKRVRIY